MKDYGIDPEKIIKLPTLGDYQIEKLLGENQFGRVIQCKHLESGVRRAIRVFDRKRPKQQPDDQLREEYNEKLWADAKFYKLNDDEHLEPIELQDVRSQLDYM